MGGQVEVWLQVAAFAGVFFGALIAFEGLRQVLSRSETRADARNRRMRMIAKGKTTAERLRLLRTPAEAAGISDALVFGRVGIMLRQAGVTVSPVSAVLGCLALAIALAAMSATVLPAVAAVVIGVSLGIGAPFALLRARQKERVDRLVRQLPDALDLMARGLRVGHPLNATIASVAADMPDPVAAEFGVMVDQIAYGASLVDAFMDFANRMDTEDVRYLTVAVSIQHGTGGDLAQVLTTLAQVIRDRMSMRRKIRAISAEGRLTSIFLSLLPAFILVSTSISAPGYYTGVMDDPLFRPMAAVVAVLIVANFLAMRRLVNFRF